MVRHVISDLFRSLVPAVLLGLLGLAVTVPARPASAAKLFPPLQTVEYVELEQYTGLWYEIARTRNPFERGCVGTTATYTLLDDGRVGVRNTCYIGSFDGEVNEIDGFATVADPSTNAKLSVTFPQTGRAGSSARAAGPCAREKASYERHGASSRYLQGNYWILELGPDYEYAIVGEPTRTYLWILSRTPTMDEALYQELLLEVEALGYDPAKLLVVDQTP